MNFPRSKYWFAVLLATSWLLLSPAHGQLSRPVEDLSAKLEPSRKIVYKAIGERKLQLHLFEPEGHAPATDRRSVFLIIHGGGWTGGEARKFYVIADHLAKKGILGICLEYRLMNSNAGTTVFDCVKDGRSAVRYLRSHADELAIDPDKIVVSGGSAGGHVAAGTALFSGPDVDETGEGLSTSCIPNALVLLNPVIDTSENGYGKQKIGERWRELSPVDQVKPGMPPTIMFHSTEDSVTPYAGAKLFEERMLAAGNDCELVTHEGGRHGYFLFDREIYDQLIQRLDAFLSNKGFLPAP